MLISEVEYMKKLSPKRAKKIETICDDLNNGMPDELITCEVAFVLSAMPNKVINYIVDNVFFCHFGLLTLG